jgi:poly-gamma-glutamate capsule biosynthesis protein CapA/YwtB (metallophosphatase superfamily)
VRNALKAIAALLAVLALCAPLILWSADEGATTAMDPSSATLTVPPTVVVSTTGSADDTTTTTARPETEESTLSTTTTTEPIRITVAAVGDVLTHMPIVDSVRSPIDGSYDFRPVFAPVAPYLRQADYTVANLETRLAGAERGYSGYPRFNSPTQLAYTLRWAGVDLVATANNHSLDMGWDGIVSTLDNLEAEGLAHVGTYRSAEERAAPLVVDIQGIRVGFINHTASLNGLVPPADKPFAVARLDVDRVIQDAVTARAWGADVVIALLHFGNEYEREPSLEQQEITQKLLSGGVDVVLGSHPHVVQPIEHVFEYSGWKVTDKFVVYSLGNFVSNQRWQYSDSGLVAYVHLEKRGLRTYVTGVSYLPVYVQRTNVSGRTAFRVLPVLPGLKPESDLPVSPAEEARMAAVWEELRPLLYRPNENISPLYPGESGP